MSLLSHLVDFGNQQRHFELQNVTQQPLGLRKLRIEDVSRCHIGGIFAIETFMVCFGNRSVLLIVLGCLAILDTGCRAIGRIGESGTSINSRRLSRQGGVFIREGKWDAAEELFTNALELSDTDDRAHGGLAETLWQRGEQETAIKHMEQAVRFSGGDPKLIQRLGRMYLDVGRFTEANQQSLAALQVERNSAEVWALRGDCLKTQEKLDEALAAYHRALALRPDYPDAQMQAAEIYRMQGRYDRLLATLDRLEEGLGGIEISARAEILRGIAMRQLGQPQEARRCFARAAAKSPSDADPHLQIASLCLDEGDLQQARSCVEVALKLDPVAVRDGRWVEQLENHHRVSPSFTSELPTSESALR